MIVAVSPYHLTTREPPATAALLLAEHVVTLLPTPPTGEARGHVVDAMRQTPRYLKVMESWSYSEPLWRAGVIASLYQGQDAIHDVRDVCRRVDADPELEPLRAFMHPSLFQDHDLYLDTIARDLLKGGPDPGISLPVAAGIDRFAARHSLFAARSEPRSIAQRAESRLGTTLFAFTAPVLVQASGNAILRARDTLDAPLTALREAVVGALAAPPRSAAESRAINAAAADYARAYDLVREDLLEPDDDDPDQVRIVDATAVLTAVALDADAVLASSLTALRSAGPLVRARPAPEPDDAPALAVAGATVVGLIVKIMGGSPPRRR